MEKKRYDHGEFADAPKNYVADLMENPDDVASATGATGMLPTPPQTPAQAESYNQLYAIPQQAQQAVSAIRDQKAAKPSDNS